MSSPRSLLLDPPLDWSSIVSTKEVGLTLRSNSPADAWDDNVEEEDERDSVRLGSAVQLTECFIFLLVFVAIFLMLFRKGHCDVADLDEDCVDSFVVLQNDTRLFLFSGDDGCLDNEGVEPLEGSGSTLSVLDVNILDVRGVVEQRFLLLLIPDSDANNETFFPEDSIHSPLLLLPPPRLRC